MNRKTVYGIVLTPLLIGILTFTFNIQLPKASGTIYIREDGSVDPAYAPIIRDGNLYTLYDNIGESIVVERDGVILDGAGYILQGNLEDESIGIDLSYRSNVTIKNFEIKGFSGGIYLLDSLYNTILENTITNTYLCIALSFVRQDTIVGSCNNNIIGNTIEDSVIGIKVRSSSDNTISGNRITNNSHSNLMFGGYTGHYVAYCQNNKIIDNEISYGGGAPLSSHKAGIWLDIANGTIVSGNNLIGNNATGVSLIDWCSETTISGNNIMNNQIGVYIWGNPTSSNNIVSGNNIVGNNVSGVELTGTAGVNNVIVENNITSNTRGVYASGFGESGFTLYNNNFVDNTYQYTYSAETEGNNWDNGYPSGGNYWSDYVGTDNFWGENQSLVGFDMMGDAPYIISENEEDRYPLMEPWPMATNNYFEDHKVAVISDSSITDFSFDQELGEINFNVAAGASDSCKVIISKWLMEGAFSFLINNIPVPYSITWSAVCYMIGFTYSQGIHSVRIIGEHVNRPPLIDFPDINEDRVIDIFDVVLLAKHFGETR